MSRLVLHGWARAAFVAHNRPCRFDELPMIIDAAGDDGTAMLGLRWFDTLEDRDAYLLNVGDARKTIPYRYWWWFDIDARDDTMAFREGMAFWRWELEEVHNLTAGIDFVPMVSGRKGMKFSAMALTHPDLRWAEAFAHYTRLLRPTYHGTLDPAMATQDVARAPGSRHREVPRWQNPISPTMRGADPIDLRRLAEHALPLDDRLQLLLDPERQPSPNAETFIRHVRDEYMLDRLLADLPEEQVRLDLLARTDWTDPLTAAGLLKTKFVRNGKTGWRLHQCPICSRATSNPYVTEWGRLYCFSSHCNAFRDPEVDLVGGLPAEKWMPQVGIRPPERRSQVMAGYTPMVRRRESTTRVSQKVARQQIREGIAKAFQRDVRGELTVLRCTPGIGKTHEALYSLAATWSISPERRQELGFVRTMIATETHELAEELSGRLLSALPYHMGSNKIVQHVWGRSEDNCEWHESIGVLGRRGWDPARYFCVRCPAKEYCKYYQDLYRARHVDFVLTTWESASALVDSGQCGHFGRVVYDEDPTRSLILEVALDPNELVALESGGLGEPSLRAVSALLLHVLRTVTNAPPPRRGRRSKHQPSFNIRGQSFHQLVEIAFDHFRHHGGIDPALLTPYSDVNDLLIDAAWAVERVEPSPGFFAPKKADEGGQYHGGDPETIARFPARNTLLAIDAIARDHRRWLSLNREDFIGRSVLSWTVGAPPQIEAYLLRRPASFLPDVILDAYANETIYRAAWNVPVHLVPVEVEMPHATFIRVPIPTSRSALSEESKLIAAWQLLDNLMTLLRADGHHKILILTHKFLVDKIYKHFPALRSIKETNTEPEPVRWYWQGRGIDAYRDFTAVIAFGEPEVPPEAVTRRAQALWGGSDHPLGLGQSQEHIRLRADPRLQAVTDCFRESELAQCVQRIRLTYPPRDARREGPPGSVVSLFDKPPHRKVCILVGRLDSHLLPPPVDFRADSTMMALATTQIAIIRHHGATLTGLAPQLMGWTTVPDSTQRHLASEALTLAGAMVGAEQIMFPAPEWAQGPRRIHTIYRWEERYPETHRTAPGVLHTISSSIPPSRGRTIEGKVRQEEVEEKPLPVRWHGVRLPNDPRCPEDIMPTALLNALLDLRSIRQPEKAQDRIRVLLYPAEQAGEWERPQTSKTHQAPEGA